MNSKFALIVILSFILTSFSIYGEYLYGDYYFCNEAGNKVNNVNAIGWKCLDINCVTIDREIIMFTNQPLTSNENFLRLNFPNPSQRTYYALYFYVNDYQARYGKITLDPWTGSTTNWFTYSCGNAQSTVTRKDNCQATFTPSIQSCAEAGLPLSILTDTELSADTTSAFGPYSYYWPPELAAWDRVNTRMNLDIKKQGTSSSVSGFPTYDEKVIYGGTSYNFNFLWQTSKDTLPGEYKITMTSTVPDVKCDQTNMIPTTQEINVYIAPSLDGCRAEIGQFTPPSTAGMTAMPTSLTFTGTRLTEYQDWNYTSISACQIEDPQLVGAILFATEYNLTIYNTSNNKPVNSTKGSWPASSTFNSPQSFSISWRNPLPGSFRANLSITSAGDIAVCENMGISQNVSATFEVGTDNDNDKWYNLAGDCNDNNASIYPGAIEICNRVDDNCNDEIDENDVCSKTVYYCDRDGDGFFSKELEPEDYCEGEGCIIPDGCRTTIGDDCNDNDPNLNGPITYYRDLDEDGYGNPSVSLLFCPDTQLPDFILDNRDCDDSNELINPGQKEVCTDSDSLDEDCDGKANCYDADCTDIFKDIFNPCTCVISNNGVEICDGNDNNCDGDIDEGLSNCCSPNGKTRSCVLQDCPTYEGIETCVNYEWEGICRGECYNPPIIIPTIPNITFLSPKNNTVYITNDCKDFKRRDLEISYIEGVQCQYMKYKTYVPFENKETVYFPLGTNTLTVKCNNEIASINFTVEKGQDCKNLNLPNPDTDEFDSEMNYSNEDIEAAKNTGDVLKQETIFFYDEEGTTITHILTPNKELGELDVALLIPKCLTPYLDDLDIDLKGYKVIKEDPLIAWHFTNVKKDIEISYKIKRQIPEDCLKQIRLLPIAKVIGDKLNYNPTGIEKFLYAGIIIAMALSIVIYLQRFHPEIIKYSEEQYEKKAIEAGFEHLLKEVRGQNLKSNQQRENYMQSRGFDEKEKEYIRKRI